MRMKSIHRAVAGAAFAALLGLGLSVPVTRAQTNPPAPNTAEINPATPVSLTVHKHQGPAVDCPNDGTNATTDANGDPITVAECVTAAGAPALEGAKFTVTPVLFDPDGAGPAPAAPIDLTTNEGWEAAKNFLDDWDGSTTYPADYSPGTESPAVTTNANGVAAFPGLTKTLYIVTETAPPTTPPTGETYTMSSPFAVTLPRSTVDGTAWNYDVHVFPKNLKSTANKVVIDDRTAGTDSGTSASDTVTYVVTTSIEPGYVVSTATTGTALTTYWVYDTFDPRLTPPAAADVVVQITKASAPTSTTLQMDTDYTVEIVGQKVTVKFTQTGLDKLVTAKNGDASAQVVTTFPTTLTDSNCDADVDTPQIECTDIVDGVIQNTAYFVPNQSAVDANGTPVGTPTNEVTSKYNNLKVLKQNSEDSSKLLTGAIFELYQINGTSCTSTSLAAELAAAPPTAVKIDTETTDDTGVINWPSLKTSDQYNDTVISTNRNYCLVETTPPPGYVLPTNPYTYVRLPDPDAGVPAFEVEITNVEESGNELPLTGGAGVAAVSILGLLLIGGGIGYYVVSTRRRRQADHR